MSITAEVEGDVITYAVRVLNRGPATATNVQVASDLPDGATLQGVSGGRDCGAGDPLVCRLGDLAAGQEVVIEIRVRAPEGGLLAFAATASANELDAVGNDNSAATALRVVPPQPRLGLTVVAEVVRGRVRVRLPGSTTFVELTGADDIPVGSLVDTRAGAVEITSATGLAAAGRLLAGGQPRTQSAVFYEGLFQITQERLRGAYTVLTLRGGNFRRICRASRALAVAGGRTPRPVRRLWGNGEGRFRTKGRHSAATVRGTLWLTSDRCDGTLTDVRRGRVEVRDFRLRRTILLRAGQRYVARPRRP